MVAICEKLKIVLVKIIILYSKKCSFIGVLNRTKKKQIYIRIIQR